VPESLLLGERVSQQRRRKRAATDPDLVIRNLTELHVGAPVVHEHHGVGRYLGLQSLEVGGQRGSSWRSSTTEATSSTSRSPRCT